MKRKGSMFALCLLLLTGCGVEPEKRAYPLVVSLDVQGDSYEVRYGMARLASITGQDKEPKGDETQAEVYRGKTLAQARENYHKSQQYYLDTGHVQAILLGEGLLKDREQLNKALTEMEENRMLGSACLVFACADPGRVMELDGKKVESLGEYLAGIFENRPSGQAVKGVTLQQVYSFWHENGRVRKLPYVRLGENGLPVVDNMD